MPNKPLPVENLARLTVREFREGLAARDFSAAEAVQDIAKRIKELEPSIGAYLSLFLEEALEAARAVDADLAAGDLPPLAGVPLAVKDAILIEGKPATAASKMLEGYTAAYDATAIQKLKTQRSIFLGKTNLDEFAMGASTENSGFKLTKNPHDPSRVPGGSSGGSAAAVAAHMALAALGSDTGGSIRQPAAFCGVAGLKPTYGAVSRSGLIAMTSSLDQIGPIAKTAEDAAMLFDAVRGKDPLDSTSAGADYGKELLEPDAARIKKLVIGIPKEYFSGGMDKDVERGVQAAIEKLKKLGFKFADVSLPHTRYALSAYYIIVPAEVSSNMARFDGIRYPVRGGASNGGTGLHSSLRDIYFKERGEKIGPEVKRRIILGTFVLSSGYYDAYYDKAQRVRSLIARDFKEAFGKCDALLTPVSPTPAFKIGEKTSDPLTMYLSDIFTIPVNLAGLPGLSLPTEPAPYDRTPPKKLPVGFQLIGKHFREADILGIGRIYEGTL